MKCHDFSSEVQMSDIFVSKITHLMLQQQKNVHLKVYLSFIVDFYDARNVLVHRCPRGLGIIGTRVAFYAAARGSIPGLFE